MPLQFDSGAYQNIFNRGREIEEANRRRPFDALSELAQNSGQMAQQAQASRMQQIALQMQREAAARKNRTLGSMAPYGLPPAQANPWDQPAPVNPGQGESGLPNASAPATGGLIAQFWKSRGGQMRAPSGQSPRPDMAALGLPQSFANVPVEDMENIYKAKSMFTPKTPTSIDSILAQRVSSGQMTLEDAIQSKRSPGVPGDFLSPQDLIASGFDEETANRLGMQYGGKIPKDRVALAATIYSRNQTQDTKDSNQQDKLEQEARQGITSLRGDKSLSDAEAKRDASITVYNTIKEIKDAGRMPSKLEYFDLLGQMWKARTGASPTDQAIRDLDSQTFKGDLAKAYTYMSGSPAGATTAEVLDNIQQFAASSGGMADKLHEGYMKTHTIKPQGLDDSRWAPIQKTGRGHSFRDATGYSGNSSTSKPKTVNQGGFTYTLNEATGQYE